eukprot:2180749-Rhodomonas_salina.1
MPRQHQAPPTGSCRAGGYESLRAKADSDRKPKARAASQSNQDDANCQSTSPSCAVAAEHLPLRCERSQVKGYLAVRCEGSQAPRTYAAPAPLARPRSRCRKFLVARYPACQYSVGYCSTGLGRAL